MFLGQEVQYGMVYIAYHTELDLQICNYAQKWRICRENSKYAPDKIFVIERNILVDFFSLLLKSYGDKTSLKILYG